MREWILERRYPLVLALIASLILVLGMLLKPEKHTAEVTISQAELQVLQRRAERKRLEELSAHFASIASDVNDHVVWISTLDQSGIVWGANGLIVTARPEAPLAAMVTIGEPNVSPLTASVAFHARELPFMAFRSSSTLLPAKIVPVEQLQSGSWFVVVSEKTSGRPLFTPGVFSGVVQASCEGWSYRELQTNLPFSSAMLGAGIFDLDSRLIGVVLRCGNSFTAAAAEDVNAALRRSVSSPARLVNEYGMRLQPLREALAVHFGVASGVVVGEVWENSPAARAGIKPGDIIQAVAGENVNSLPEVTQTLIERANSGGEVTLRIKRGGRSMSRTVAMNAPELQGRSAGIVVSPPDEGILIADITGGSRAAEAGIRPGDRLLEIDGRQVSSRRALENLREDRTAFLILKREDKTFGVLLP